MKSDRSSKIASIPCKKTTPYRNESRPGAKRDRKKGKHKPEGTDWMHNLETDHDHLVHFDHRQRLHFSDKTIAIRITADMSLNTRLEADFKREYQNMEFLFRQRPGLG